MVVKLKSPWHKRSTVVEFYDSDQDLPAKNYNSYQQLVMLDLGIGSDLEAFNAHFANLFSYVTHGKKNESINEIQNLFRGFYQQIENYSSRSYQLLPFIKSINNEQYEIGDLDKCREDINMLSDSGLTNGHLQQLLAELRKKSWTSLQQLFTKVLSTQDLLTQMPKFSGKHSSL